jgi:hypothetical protein
MIVDILCYLFFILLVDGYKHIMLGVSGIVKHPVPSWMISFIFITADRYVRRGGDALKEDGWSFYCCPIDIGLNEVSEGRNVGKVDDGIILAKGDGQR